MLIQYLNGVQCQLYYCTLFGSQSFSLLSTHVLLQERPNSEVSISHSYCENSHEFQLLLPSRFITLSLDSWPNSLAALKIIWVPCRGETDRWVTMLFGRYAAKWGVCSGVWTQKASSEMSKEGNTALQIGKRRKVSVLRCSLSISRTVTNRLECHAAIENMFGCFAIQKRKQMVVLKWIAFIHPYMLYDHTHSRNVLTMT